tara:strand:- start:203 stop:898 length:696 start_codon:yes stop_codon:yes gene_type:complete
MSINFITCLFDDPSADIPDWYQGVYSSEWVDKLYRGIQRNFKGDFNLYCLVDKKYEFQESIIQVPLEDRPIGWLSMMEYYRPELCAGQRFCLGLDSIFVGDLSSICSTTKDHVLVRDPYCPQYVCNAIETFNQTKAEEIWEKWTDRKEYWRKTCLASWLSDELKVPSEMQFLRDNYNDAPVFDDVLPGRILSYKAHILNQPHDLTSCSLVYFHGKPKPCDDIDSAIKAHWI